MLATTQNHSNVNPSPRGRGQGEGGRSAKGGQFAFLTNFQIMVQRPPSTRPSPPGEGELFPDCWKVPAAGSSVTLATTQNHSNVKPSPRGRGQGEGERSAEGGRLAILFQRLALTLTNLDFSISELPSAPAQPVAKSPQSCLTIPAVEYKLYPCASLKKRSWWRQGGDIPRQLVTWRSGARRSRRLRGAIWWMCGNVIRT